MKRIKYSENTVSNPTSKHRNLTPWKPGQSGNPHGKPKGSKHLSTKIREMLEDKNFKYDLSENSAIMTTPIDAILITLINKAVGGDLKAFELLAKYGYDPGKKSSPESSFVISQDSGFRMSKYIS